MKQNPTSIIPHQGVITTMAGLEILHKSLIKNFSFPQGVLKENQAVQYLQIGLPNVIRSCWKLIKLTNSCCAFMSRSPTFKTEL